MPKPLLLASSSRYRAGLLQRLRLPFDIASPELDERPRDGESPVALARRLAHDKALALTVRHPECCIIGSDQTASLAGRLLGKPGSAAAQAEQLAACSGRCVDFHTAVCVIADGRAHEESVRTRVRFRALSGDEIARYVEAEPAADCCGGFKAEGLGISLFEALESEDPTALIGLPLIATARLLRAAGLPVP